MKLKERINQTADRLKQVGGLSPLGSRMFGGDETQVALYALLYGIDLNNKKEVSMEELTQLAHDNFARWNDALQTGDPQKVAALYTKDCLFLPTLDDKYRVGREKATEYFVHFLAKKPFGTIIDDGVIASDDGNSYTHVGLYDFEVSEPDNTDNRSVAHARFTYTWQKVGGEWLISHHHSSLVPTK